MQGRVERAAAFLNRSRSIHGGNGLIQASSYGHLPAVELFLRARANVNAQATTSGITPLMKAAECGHETVVSRLLLANADTTLTSVEGRTALVFAERHGNAIIQSLLKPTRECSRSDDDEAPPAESSNSAGM